MLNAAFWNVRSLNKRDQLLALKDLVAEFRLHFVGILETRVRVNNGYRIQAVILPQWKWFVDNEITRNRIWIAWHDDFIDVNVLDLGSQFVHCRVIICACNEPMFITVIYGANEVIDRRQLWESLNMLGNKSMDDPWLVEGGFNAVRDISEVYGTSGDIKMAMEELYACIQSTALHSLSMQGECLWKRLDRMPINDTWLTRFPTSCYTSLLLRTSDHSPLD
ncbi:UNVERIFIED_CONTAM: hypothetical protein Sindi_2668600 [Sesamum indicum]